MLWLMLVRLLIPAIAVAGWAAPALAEPVGGGPESDTPADTASTPAVPKQPPGEVIEMTGQAPDTGEAVTYELTPEVIRKMPGTGNDAIKSLQTMPSVGRVPYGMGGLVLRGTSPRDSSVYLDGIAVPLLYHFGGLASFYPSALLESLELTPGGYSVEFGRGQGGVVTLQSRAGRSDRWRVASEISMTDASLRGDGPSGRFGTWSLALRRSYIDAVLPLISTGDDDITNAPRYMDGQLRYDVDLWHGAQATAMLFGSDDKIGVRYGVANDRTFDFDTRFARLGLRLRQRRGDSVFELTPWVGVDRYHLASTFQTMTSADDPMGVRARVARDGRRGSVAAGVDIAAHDFNVSSRTDDDGQITDISRAGTYQDAALWIEGLIQFGGGRYAVKPGLRVDSFGLADAITIDPRVVATQQVSSRLSLRQSVGMFHQPPTAADHLWGNDALEPSYSMQASFGAKLGLGRQGSVGVSGFWSELRNLAVDDPDADDSMLNNLQTYKIGAIASSREFIAKQFGTFSELANLGHGRVYGFELIGQYVGRRAFAWLSYTYSRSWRRTGDMERHPWVLDQPHVLTAVGSWQIGTAWRVGGRLRVASGNPLTPVVGSTQVAVDEWEPVFGPEMSERLPTFVQVDLRVDREWRRKWGTISAFLDIQNATRRVNVEGRVYEDDFSHYEPTNGLPLFPSFGIAYTPAP